MRRLSLSVCVDPGSTEHRGPGPSHRTQEPGTLDDQSARRERAGAEEEEEEEEEALEETDRPEMEDKEDTHQDHHEDHNQDLHQDNHQDHHQDPHDGLSPKKRSAPANNPHPLEHQPSGLMTPRQPHDPGHRGSLFTAEHFDFEEFVMDFDDYDLLESIHSQLASPLEPVREYKYHEYKYQYQY